MITGSPDPQKRPSGNSCKRVAIPEIKSADWIRIICSDGLPPVTPARMIAGVTQPTIIATTCCTARGSASRNRGRPFSSITLA